LSTGPLLKTGSGDWPTCCDETSNPLDVYRYPQPLRPLGTTVIIGMSSCPHPERVIIATGLLEDQLDALIFFQYEFGMRIYIPFTNHGVELVVLDVVDETLPRWAGSTTSPRPLVAPSLNGSLGLNWQPARAPRRHLSSCGRFHRHLTVFEVAGPVVVGRSCRPDSAGNPGNYVTVQLGEFNPLPTIQLLTVKAYSLRVIS